MTRAHTKTLSFRNPAIVFVTIVMLMTVPWAAAQKGKDKKKDVVAEVKPQVDTSKLVWPPAPDVTRVKWLQAISGELDLNPEVAKTKKKSSWMDRMAGVQTLERFAGEMVAAGDPVLRQMLVGRG